MAAAALGASPFNVARPASKASPIDTLREIGCGGDAAAYLRNAAIHKRQTREISAQRNNPTSPGDFCYPAATSRFLSGGREFL